MRIKLLLLACLLPWPVSAQMTTCVGDVCVEEKNGVTRTLSNDEVKTIQRSNSRTAITNIKCEAAENPGQCSRIQKILFSLFPL